jgi:hypothetical protein
MLITTEGITMNPKIFFLNTFSKWGGGAKWTFETDCR